MEPDKEKKTEPLAESIAAESAENKIEGEGALARLRKHKRRKIFDQPVAVIFCMMAFLTVMVGYLQYQSAREPNTPKVVYVPFMYPAEKLLRGEVTPRPTAEEKERVEVVYDFAQATADPEKLAHLIKDWEGTFVNERDWARPVRFDRNSKLPLAPIFSTTVWEGSIEVEAELAILRPTGVLIAFHAFFLREESTGTGLRIKADGETQLIQFRRQLQLDYRLGDKATLPELFKESDVVHFKLAFDAKSRRTVGIVNDRTKVVGQTHLFWPEDRAYTYGETQKDLYADYPKAPGDGFVGIVGGVRNSIVIRRVVICGTLGTAWRIDRTKIKLTDEALERRLKAAWEKESADGQAEEQPQNESEETEAEPQTEKPNDQIPENSNP